MQIKPRDFVRYEQEVRERDIRRGPQYAEIVPGHEPYWHVVVVEPRAERIAAAHLVGRRFGVYLPEFDVRMPAARGRDTYMASRPIFPGYLFLFVWDVEQHLRRIQACPGVFRLMYDGGRPVIVSDAIMDQIQAIEGFNLVNSRIRRRRVRRREPLSLEPDVEVTVSTLSLFEGIKGLDDRGRVSILHRALGLA